MTPARCLILLLALLLAFAAGCGDDSEPDSAGAAEAAPVTVKHALGEAKLASPPERVVTLDFPSTDAVVALGVKPVAMAKISYVEGGVQSWTKEALDQLDGPDPEQLVTDNGFPLEKIAALKPDVIVGTNTFPLIAESYDKLTAIAPVVAHTGTVGADPWQDGVKVIGQALGRPDEAEKLVSDAERTVEQTKADHPEFAGKTVSLFNYVPGDALYVINDDKDASLRFLQTLGFQGATDTIAQAKGGDGRAEISAENYDQVEADVVIGTSTDPKAIAELEQDTQFARVPAVEDGRFLGMEIGPATAMAFPSVLSIPYAARELAPRMGDALK